MPPTTQTPPLPLSGKSSAERMFSTLTPAQLARLVAHGKRRPTHRGDILFEAGDPVSPFFVVIAGRVEVVRPSGTNVPQLGYRPKRLDAEHLG